MNGALSDEELMMLISTRNEEALINLYDRYERPVYAFAYRMVKDAVTAEEIVQELFVAIWNANEKYDGKQGELTGWMFNLTRSLAVDLLRKSRSRAQEQIVEPEEPPFAADGQSDTVEEDSERTGERIKSALEGLNRDRMQIIEWIYYQGYTHQEVSSRHSIPAVTVRHRASLALKQLRLRLADPGRSGGGNE